MTRLVIFDIDGTLSDSTHRIHLIEKTPRKDWGKFYKESVNDDPMEHVVKMNHLLAKSREFFNDWKDVEIVVVTGRSDICRDETEQWLRRHEIVYDELYMRKEGDHRPDYIIKEEILKAFGNKKPWLVFEDRDQVVDMWRKNGVKCFQVNYGDF